MSEEKYGVEVLDSALLSLAEVLNVLYRFFGEKAGLFSLLGLQKPAMVLASLDLAKLKAEVADYSEAERESSQAKFKAALHPALQAKVGSGVDLLEEGADLAEEGIAFAKSAYQSALNFIASGKALIAKVKALLGV